MQKISSYLYPNRIVLLADLAGFNVEFTNVYQRNVKIYNGIDNTIEFDIKNADQKRIDLTTISQIKLNIMDASGYELPNSPYDVVPTLLKGIATVTIPQEDLVDLDNQYLKYSVSALKDGKDVLLYTDARFGAVGTIELVGDAMPLIRDSKIYNTFTAEIDLNGVPIYHSSAIPCKFYEAIPTETLNFDIYVTNFAGSIWLDATTNSTINLQAFQAAGKPFGAWNQSAADGLYTGIIPFGTNIPVGDYNYFRVSYQSPSVNGVGASFDVRQSGTTYSVVVHSTGTGYTAGSIIKIPGSHVGGIDGINDLIITVTSVHGVSSTAPSSYTISSIGDISWTGTAANNSKFFPAVTGANYSGTIDKIVVS
jgi:hypothetical protein